MGSVKRQVSIEELRQHASPDNCWLLVNGVVWDLSAFAPEHPGGADGQDASATYNGIHAPSLLENELDRSKMMGVYTGPPATVPAESPAHPSAESKDDEQPTGRRPLASIISTHDFEEAASHNLSAKAWAFFSSAATDCITQRANETYFGRIWLRPRIMRDVRAVSCETTMLGVRVPLPLFASPTAMARLAHDEGELVIAKGCSKLGVPQTISTNASFPLPEITSSATTPFFFQLYVNKDRAASERLLRQAESCGARAVLVTVDQPTPGKREADERVKAEGVVLAPTPNGATASNDGQGSGLGRTMAGFIDASLGWDDVAWLRRATGLPVVLKGVQTAEDVVLAAEHGVDGVVLGNHGGRSLDTSPPAVAILLELHRVCPDVFGRLEVFLDGGVRRGTDVFKALCLGARAVGMGRPFLYAANYGAEGVEKLVDIMRDEFETTMRMMGCTDLSQLHPGLLNLCDVKHWGEGIVATATRAKL